MRLDPSAVAAGVQLHALATIDSTNQEARLRGRQDERAPLWVTAVAQTAGRGRMDRSWVSPPGNLYASLLLHDPSPSERAPELAFVAAAATRDAIVAEAPPLKSEIAFKWPNDILLAGQKCAGILIEGEVAPNQTFSVVIGIGVNCTSHPAKAAYPATDLRARGADITPEQLFERLSATTLRRLAQWDRGRGFPAIMADWLSAAHRLGEEVAVRSGTGEKRGRFVGLDPSGRLILELPDGVTEKISAGDVFPLQLRV